MEKLYESGRIVAWGAPNLKISKLYSDEIKSLCTIFDIKAPFGFCVDGVFCYVYGERMKIQTEWNLNQILKSFRDVQG